MSALSIAILVFILAVCLPVALLALMASPAMRTASNRQIERDVDAIQGKVPNPRLRAGCDVAQFQKSRDTASQWASAGGRHAARLEVARGEVAVNPYHVDDSEFVIWAIALAEERTKLSYAAQVTESKPLRKS